MLLHDPHTGLRSPLPLRKVMLIPVGTGRGWPSRTSRCSLKGPVKRTVRRPGVNNSLTWGLILVAAKNIILLVNVVILAPKKKVVLKGKFYYHIINLFIPLLNNKTKKILLRYTKKFWYHLLRVNELGRSEASISITRTNAILFSFSFSHDQHSILPCSLHTCECVRPAWCRLYFPVASL